MDLYLANASDPYQASIGGGVTPPPPITCAYPLDLDEATLQAFGYTGRLTLSNGFQTGDYIIQGGLAARETYAAAANPGTTLDASTGDHSFRWRFDAMPIVSSGAPRAVLKIYNTDLSVVLYTIEYYPDFLGEAVLVIVDSAMNQIYNDQGSSLPAASNIDFRWNAGAGVLTVYRSGLALTLSDGGVYTPQAIFPVFEAVEPTGVTPATGDEHITQTLGISASYMTGATWLSGSTDFCGTAIT